MAISGRGAKLCFGGELAVPRATVMNCAGLRTRERKSPGLEQRASAGVGAWLLAAACGIGFSGFYTTPFSALRILNPVFTALGKRGNISFLTAVTHTINR